MVPVRLWLQFTFTASARVRAKVLVVAVVGLGPVLGFWFWFGFGLGCEYVGNPTRPRVSALDHASILERSSSSPGPRMSRLNSSRLGESIKCHVIRSIWQDA